MENQKNIQITNLERKVRKRGGIINSLVVVIILLLGLAISLAIKCSEPPAELRDLPLEYIERDTIHTSDSTYIINEYTVDHNVRDVWVIWID